MQKGKATREAEHAAHHPEHGLLNTDSAHNPPTMATDPYTPLREGEQYADEAVETEKAPLIPGAQPPIYRGAIIATIPIFMGYAALISMQAKVKERIGIAKNDQTSEKSYLFGLGFSFLFLGNLIFRLMHNVLFSFLRPRQRVMLAYCCMCVAISSIAVVYYIINSKSVGFIFAAYMLGGVAIGTFESNLISCLTPLGHMTKKWAVMGMPVGYNGTAILGFVLFSIIPHDPHVQMSVFLFIAGCNVLGLLYFIFYIPIVRFEASGDNVKKFVKDIVKFREWAPLIAFNAFSLFIDMFCVIMMSSIVLYIFEVNNVPLWPKSRTTIPKNVFQTIYNTCAFLGDFIARRVVYHTVHHDADPNGCVARTLPKQPYWYLMLTVVGVGLGLCKVALVAPIGMFLVMYANGSIYGHTTKHIDNNVPRTFNLIALSVWLFVGDLGSFLAANTVTGLRNVIGPVPVAGNSTYF